MRQELKPIVRGARLRRCAVALAVGAMLGTATAACAFDIDTGNPDIQMRWDNTIRYNLGVRAQSQNTKILGSPNFDDGDRNFGNGSLVTNRFDVLSEFDFVFQKKYGFRVSGAGWYDNAYQSLDNHNDATANTLVNGLPVAGVLESPTRSATRRAFRASSSTRSRSRTSTRATCRSTSRRASTRSTGATASCSAARSTAFRTDRIRSTSGRALQRRAARRRSCFVRAAASRIAGAADERICRSPANGSTTGRRIASPNRAAI